MVIASLYLLKLFLLLAEKDQEELQKQIDRKQDEIGGLREQLREVEQEKQAEIIKLTLEVHVKPHTNLWVIFLLLSGWDILNKSLDRHTTSTIFGQWIILISS